MLGPKDPLPHSFLIKMAQHAGACLDLIYGDCVCGDTVSGSVATGDAFLGHLVDVRSHSRHQRWHTDLKDGSTTPLMRVAMPILLGELLVFAFPDHPVCGLIVSRLGMMLQLAVAVFGVRALLRASPQPLLTPPEGGVPSKGYVPPNVAHGSIERLLAEVRDVLPDAAAITLDVLRSLRRVSSSHTPNAPPRFSNVTLKMDVLVVALEGLAGQLLEAASCLAKWALYRPPRAASSVELRVDADTSALIRELTGELVPTMLPEEAGPQLPASQDEWLKGRLPAGAQAPHPGLLGETFELLLDDASTPPHARERVPAARLLVELVSQLGAALPVAVQEGVEEQRKRQLHMLQLWQQAEATLAEPDVATASPMGVAHTPRTHSLLQEGNPINVFPPPSPEVQDDVFSQPLSGPSNPPLRTARLFEAISLIELSQKRQRDEPPTRTYRLASMRRRPQ